MKVSLFPTLLGVVILLLLLQTCAGPKAVVSIPERPVGVPKLPREFRAAWVASVANINWPSEPGLSIPVLKAEARELLDLLVDHHFNAVIFQVRPQGDALYQSDLEPWSYFLTGLQGRAPEEDFDPLAFWIEEAHARGLELHAWLNPYRAKHVSGGDSISEQSVIKKHPELVTELENGYWWMIPTMQGTQDHSYQVVMDIVQRYNVDGIHFDDYFYPYPSYNNNQDFPDEESWQKYQKTGGALSKDDWRRDAVNIFIKRVYEGIKTEKPHVKFGLSPFGIWRPGHPESIAGFDQYDKLYADAKLWLNQGWIDYFTPQLYWPTNQIPQSFPVLLGWWARENLQARHLWPGISIGRLEGEKAVDETINQIMITRGMVPESPGLAHWSIAPLVLRQELRKGILDGPYKQRALVPASPWLGQTDLKTPEQMAKDRIKTFEISWVYPKPEQITFWVVQAKYGAKWTTQVYGSELNSVRIPKIEREEVILPEAERMGGDSIWVIERPLTRVAITLIDQFGAETQAKEVALDHLNN